MHLLLILFFSLASPGVAQSGPPIVVYPSSVTYAGAIPDADLDSTSVTLQGNSFNGNSQLVQTTSVGGITLSGPILTSSATLSGVAISSQTAGAAGAAVTATCRVAGTFALGGGCSCTGAVGITSVIGEPNVTTAGSIATGWTCQDAGGTGAACAAFVICSRNQ